MNSTARINTFSELGRFLDALDEPEFQTIAERAARENPWFTKENVRMAVDGVIRMLQKEKLEQWISPYNFSSPSRNVAVVMAGNIPMVGFHDFLAVLMAGHSILIKLSSKDTSLIRFIVDKLIDIEPAFEQRIVFAEQLKNFDAVIATGSDNTARYFEYYFGKYPHIIRKNRTSVAILEGDESSDTLKAFGQDVFSYFGLGCRNVSKIFVPAGYDFAKLFPSWQSFENIIHHHKYCNNYDYQKSIMLVNQIPFLDNGFVMLHENQRLVSPISVLYTEAYNGKDELLNTLNSASDKIQCIVGTSSLATVKPGEAQYPEVWDYADRVDTLKFLSNL